MDLKDLMKTRPESLAELQIAELKKHAIGILKDVIEALDTDDFDKLDRMLCYSPAGDCMGTNTHHIDFSYEDNVEMDLNDIISTIKNLGRVVADAKRR